MEKNQFRLMARCVISACVLLFVLSFWIDKIAALVLLFAAVTGAAEVFALSLKYSQSLSTKLLNFILLLLFCGRWFFVFGCQQIASYFYLAVLLFGAILVLWGAFYLNKYCGPDAESKLDEPQR